MQNQGQNPTTTFIQMGAVATGYTWLSARWLQTHCDDPKRDLPPPLPQDKQEVEPAFDLLKSMVPVGRAALDNLNLPPPLAHSAHDAVDMGAALEKFIGGVYNTELPLTVALEDINEVGYIIYLIQLRCQPFRDCSYLHFVRTLQGFLVIAAFVQCLAKNGQEPQKIFTCLCGNQTAEDGFCLVRALLIDHNCSGLSWQYGCRQGGGGGRLPTALM